MNYVREALGLGSGGMDVCLRYGKREEVKRVEITLAEKAKKTRRSSWEAAGRQSFPWRACMEYEK